MDIVSLSMLNANNGLEEYDNLNGSYLAIDNLVPSLGRTQRNQGMIVYKKSTLVLRDYLLKNDTINKEVCPTAYK